MVWLIAGVSVAVGAAIALAGVAIVVLLTASTITHLAGRWNEPWSG